MPVMEWNTRLLVGVGQIDREHMQLVRLINDLHEAMAMGRGDRIAEKVLTDLLEYTRTHFANEEALMVAHAYPKYNGHRAMHRTLVERVTRGLAEVREGRPGTSVKLQAFLRDWLQTHILTVDRAFAEYLNKLGVS